MKLELMSRRDLFGSFFPKVYIYIFIIIYIYIYINYHNHPIAPTGDCSPAQAYSRQKLLTVQPVESRSGANVAADKVNDGELGKCTRKGIDLSRLSMVE